MSKDKQTDEPIDHAERAEELAELRKEADELGVKYHHLAGPDTIRQKIEEHLAALEDKQAEEIKNIRPEDVPQPISAAAMERRLFEEKKREANRLVRIRVQCMDPTKKEWPGEIISVGSAKLGTFKKYIPYNNEPYHVPKIIYQELKERKCTVFITETLPNGQKTRKGKLVPAYAIEVLPPLTPQEIKDLAQRQAMASGGSN